MQTAGHSRSRRSSIRRSSRRTGRNATVAPPRTRSAGWCLTPCSLALGLGCRSSLVCATVHAKRRPTAPPVTDPEACALQRRDREGLGKARLMMIFARRCPARHWSHRVYSVGASQGFLPKPDRFRRRASGRAQGARSTKTCAICSSSIAWASCRTRLSDRPSRICRKSWPGCWRRSTR